MANIKEEIKRRRTFAIISHPDAVGFYEKLGMEKSTDVMQYNEMEWTRFTVE